MKVKSKQIIRGFWILIVSLIILSMFGFLLAPLFGGYGFF